MSDKTIYVRARPRSLRATETYFYNREISRNPTATSSAEKHPLGRLEVSFPYDGELWFGREAVKDVETQLGQGSTGPAEALVGHLVLNEYDQTDLREVLDLTDHHGAVPLHIPVQGNGLTGPADLTSDRYACELVFDYIPHWPELLPISADMQLLDEEVLEPPSGNIAGDQLLEVASRIAQQVSFQRSLLLKIVVHVDLPAKLNLEGGIPMMHSIRLKWPTIPSFRSLALSLGGEERSISYDPITSSLTWGQVPLDRQQNNGSEVRRYLTAPMVLFIQQPGELYQQTSVEGETEVEIPNQLMSGLKMRMMNGTGHLFQDVKPALSTRLVCGFRLVLEDAFARRDLSPYQHLYFDGVIPDVMRIADIKTALTDRGFRISFDQNIALPSDPTTLRHFILAEHKEGTDTMELWVFIEGKRYETERQTQVAGGQTYTSKFESGELKVYVRSELPGNSRALIREMNALQAALRDRFERLRAKR